MLPVSIAFWHKMKAERYYFLWQKKKADEESKSQEPCRLTLGKTPGVHSMNIRVGGGGGGGGATGAP